MPAIRQARRGDEQRLRDVRLRSLADTPDAFASTLAQESAFATSRWVELTAQSDSGRERVVYAAVADGRWLGMAGGHWFDPDSRIAALWGMWVEPAARGLGLGERLVATVDAWAADLGARVLRLGVVDGMSAQSFYERLGFTVTGERRPLPRDERRVAVFLSRPIGH
ncbi:MAG: GNAT family N-acetyltransferase [Actinomycetota bacterium]|nr:GNAT family N-acetyltransferase [Actinomycetota bacterium]